MQTNKRAFVHCIVVAAAALGACSSPSNPGSVPPTATTAVDSRIIGGTVVGTLPGVGSLGGCTGTLINPYKVLTAAHCIAGHQPNEFEFLIGRDTSNPLYSLPVVSLDVAPGFDAALDNDLGVATLGVAAPVPTMPLINAIDSNWVGRDLIFVGYGDSNGVSRSGAGLARDVSIPIAQVEPKIITFGGNGANTCFGDSGGPSFFQDAAGNLLLVSVTSYATTENCTGPSGATRVDAYLDFIGEPGQAPSLSSSGPTQGTGNTGGGGGTTGGTSTGGTGSGCGSETAQGRCSGDEVIWCANNQVQEQNCATAGGHCSWSYLNQIYGCATGPAPSSDPCDGETFEGRCDDNVSIWCYDGTTIVRDNCTTNGQICAYNATLGYYDCLPGQ